VPADTVASAGRPKLNPDFSLRDFFRHKQDYRAEFEREHPRQTGRHATLSLDLSERAFRRFEELPIPGGRGGRGWKHDYAAIGAPGFARWDEAGPRSNASLGSLADDFAISGLLRLGYPRIEATLNERVNGHLERGIEIEDASAFRPQVREFFDAHIGSAVRWEDDKFAALALALADCGALIRVKAGVRVAQPFLIEHDVNSDVDLPYIQVIVEDGAAVTIVEDVTSGPSFGCGMVELIVGEGASVDYVVLQRRAPESTLFMTRGAVCARNATCRWFVAELGAGLSRSVITTRLAGPGANVEADAFFFTDGDQHVDLTTAVEHEVGSTTSRTAVKSAATDKGQGRYLGNIRIAQHATGSDATLRDDVLLLSKGAHIDSIPALEIASNDVKAFHGATIGSIDADELFYAESRGIARADAERMIALGFFEPLVSRFPEAKIREALTSILAKKLVGGATEESAT
jgi:Fe-S cluster assembly protein SufD